MTWWRMLFKKKENRKEVPAHWSKISNASFAPCPLEIVEVLYKCAFLVPSSHTFPERVVATQGEYYYYYYFFKLLFFFFILLLNTIAAVLLKLFLRHSALRRSIVAFQVITGALLISPHVVHCWRGLSWTGLGQGMAAFTCCFVEVRVMIISVKLKIPVSSKAP